MLSLVRSWLGRFTTAAIGRGQATAEERGEAEWVADWLRAEGRQPASYRLPGGRALRLLGEACPAQARQTMAAADRVVAHEFNLLGSGWYRPVDPDRRPDGEYQPIDWRLDPVSGLRFPPANFPHSSWSPAMRPGRADIKLPWELARCQHWITLGQAWRLTGQPRYADEILRQLHDFTDANPVGQGVNWVCTMDVALRAVSWTLALDLAHDACWPSQAWDRAFRALAAHGRFIRDHLENHYEVTSNHYLSNLVGLYFLGWRFAATEAGQQWLAFAEAGLTDEIEKQILPDGADFESSVPYHALVAELVLGCAVLGAHRGRPLATRVTDRLRDMMGFLEALLRPDGLMPVVGDADDGRLHVFTEYGIRNPQDVRPLLGAAGAFFGVDRWKGLSGTTGRWEAGWWGLPVEQWPDAASPSGPSVLFADAGIGVMRTGAQYLLVTNGIVGTKGFGNHKHNDQLAFEYHVEGRPVLVDAGSAAYTGDPDTRNRCRSTRSHNTLEVDGEEQNEFRPDWLFRMFEKARPEICRWDATRHIFAGRHYGYDRLESPVVHARAITLRPDLRALFWLDRLSGSGTHRCLWHLHWAPGLAVNERPDRLDISLDGRRTLALLVPPGLTVTTAPGFVSPSYGIKVPCLTTNLSATVTVHAVVQWVFALVPAEVADNHRGAGLRDSALETLSDELQR